MFVCLLATLHKNVQTDLHEIFRECWQWASEQMIKFWWRSESRIWIATPRDPDRDTGKMCRGGGMHCPSASSSNSVFVTTVQQTGWLRGPAVEHWSLADVLSLSCARLAADG